MGGLIRGIVGRSGERGEEERGREGGRRRGGAKASRMGMGRGMYGWRGFDVNGQRAGGEEIYARCVI